MTHPSKQSQASAPRINLRQWRSGEESWCGEGVWIDLSSTKDNLSGFRARRQQVTRLIEPGRIWKAEEPSHASQLRIGRHKVEVQLQHIDAGLAKGAERAAGRVTSDGRRYTILP
jgi:hypothetical protein